MAVADTGVGIPNDQLSAIFEKFVQLEDAGTRKHRGTGLGLSLVREMVKAFGGTVEVESTVGVGSTFTVRLPSREAPLGRSDDGMVA